ncbi:hypothetical protein TIFTF001_023916 [Ficus carica]|uniref:Uncharacterized protein n=1 Tax=Ficus carica TaxID=3494 RepID=A0AA88DFN7_FICCA|nr:hypothetical protein TIFTF001_023916 [Ficus carica]
MKVEGGRQRAKTRITPSPSLPPPSSPSQCGVRNPYRGGLGGEGAKSQHRRGLGQNLDRVGAKGIALERTGQGGRKGGREMASSSGSGSGVQSGGVGVGGRGWEGRGEERERAQNARLT